MPKRLQPSKCKKVFKKDCEEKLKRKKKKNLNFFSVNLTKKGQDMSLLGSRKNKTLSRPDAVYEKRFLPSWGKKRHKMTDNQIQPILFISSIGHPRRRQSLV